MAAPVAALGGAGQLAKAVSQDLVVIGGQWFREVTFGKGKTKQKVLVPMTYELHVNPVSVGLGAVALTAAVGLGWLAWNGLDGPWGNIIPGLKDGDYWPEKVGRLTKGKAGTTPPALQGDCEGLHEQYRKLNVLNDPLGFLRGQIKDVAKKAGCSWAQ